MKPKHVHYGVVNVNRTMLPEDNYKNQEEINYISNCISPRRNYYSETNPRDPVATAAHTLSCIPVEPLAEIVRGFNQRDPRMILLYADCHMYAMKSLPRDEDKAMRIYGLAAELGSPEAMVHLAREFYVRIAYAYGKYTNVDFFFWKIPRNCIYTKEEGNLRGMWHWLERSAEAGWPSFFLKDQAEHAEETGSWKLNATVKSLLEKMRRDEKKL